MTDREAKIQMRRIRALGNKWLKPIGLTAWFTVHVVYDRNEPPTDKDGRRVTATAWSDHRYQETEISFSLPRCAKLSDADLETAFVHEAVHPVLSRLQWLLPRTGAANNAVEEVVTQIAKMILWARAAGERDARAKPKRRRR